MMLPTLPPACFAIIPARPSPDKINKREPVTAGLPRSDFFDVSRETPSKKNKIGKRKNPMPMKSFKVVEIKYPTGPALPK